MGHYNTVLNQITSFFPRHEFDALAKIHHSGHKFRSFNRWSQFIAMMVAQLSGRKSLRDVTENLAAQKRKLYHIGLKRTTRATLARVNENQPYQLYEKVYFKLLSKCRHAGSPKHKFKFNGKVFLLDTTTINLCLAVFPWAKFRSTKGAVRLHTGIDADGYLPEFVSMTNGKVHEIQWARALRLQPGSCVVFDRGFTDYTWYQTLTDNKIKFITRLKRGAVVEFLNKRPGRKSAGISRDQTITLNNMKSSIRLISYTDPETGIDYDFITNAFDIQAMTVAELYKERWQIELFFKWIKQNLKVKTFLGTSENAVMTQLWIALCVYLLLSYIKFRSKLGLSLAQILRLLQLNIFERRSLDRLLRPPPDVEPPVSTQLLLWNKL